MIGEVTVKRLYNCLVTHFTSVVYKLPSNCNRYLQLHNYKFKNLNRSPEKNHVTLDVLTRYRGVVAKVRSTSSSRLSTGSRTTAGYERLYNKHAQPFTFHINRISALETDFNIVNFYSPSSKQV